MTDTATVTRHTPVRPASGAVKAGGAGASAAGTDVLEGAFAAIFDAATAGKTVLGMEAQVAAGTDAAVGKDGTLVALALEGVATGTVGAETGIQINPNIKQAEPGTGEGVESVTDPLTGKTKPRKPGAGAEAETDPTDPALLQAAAAAATAAPAQTANAPQAGTPKKDKLAIDADARGAKANVVLTLVADAKSAEKGAAAEKAPTAGAEAHSATLPAPAAAKTDTLAQASQAAMTGDNAAAEGEGNQPGANTGGQGRPSAAALARAAAKAAANDDVSLVKSDRFESIIQSLPPVVQSQLGTDAVGAAGGATPVASTSELLGNQVIDMSVSGQWIDRMAREIAKLSDGTGHSRFQLMPPNLGRIQVDVWQGDDQTNVRLLTETDEAARRLREGQGALEASARLASLSLGSVSVEKSSASLDARDQNQNQNQRQQAENGGDPQQQASAQAQSQSGQGRGNTRGPNVDGFAAVMGFEPQAESEPAVRAPSADDPRVRFA